MTIHLATRAQLQQTGGCAHAHWHTTNLHTPLPVDWISGPNDVPGVVRCRSRDHGPSCDGVPSCDRTVPIQSRSVEVESKSGGLLRQNDSPQIVQIRGDLSVASRDLLGPPCNLPLCRVWQRRRLAAINASASAGCLPGRRHAATDLVGESMCRASHQHGPDGDVEERRSSSVWLHPSLVG